MNKIAIVGKIASGKSILVEYLKEKGLKTLCLDEVVHYLYENSPILKTELISHFGIAERSEIAKIVFKDKKLLALLEKIIFPYLLNELTDFFNKNASEEIIFVAAPMLYKSGFDKYFDYVINVIANDEIIIKRLMERNSISRDEANIRLLAQVENNTPKGDNIYTIENNGSIEEFYASIKKTIESLKLHV